jgi:hypothetical protein
MSTATNNSPPPQAQKLVILDDGMSIETAVGHCKSGRVPQESLVEWLAGRDVPADRLAMLLGSGLLKPADFAFILEARDRRTERRAAKKLAPLSKTAFLEQAKEFSLVIGDKTLTVKPREFSTGSFGWFLSGKASVTVGETEVPCQIGMNVTVIGSKPKSEESAVAE